MFAAGSGFKLYEMIPAHDKGFVVKRIILDHFNFFTTRMLQCMWSVSYPQLGFQLYRVVRVVLRVVSEATGGNYNVFHP
jgi:hypothetical protein